MIGVKIGISAIFYLLVAGLLNILYIFYTKTSPPVSQHRTGGEGRRERRGRMERRREEKGGGDTARLKQHFQAQKFSIEFF